MLGKYLSEYRITPSGKGDLLPFVTAAVSRIGELSEYNAARMLKAAYHLLERAADLGRVTVIDEPFVRESRVEWSIGPEHTGPQLEEAEPADLQKKIREGG